MSITSYDSLQCKIDTAIEDFKSTVSQRIDGYFKAQGSGSDEAAWEVFTTARYQLIQDLEVLVLAIHKKLPTKQMEDTFGSEVQEGAIKSINEILGKLRGGEKESIISYSKYLGEIAGLAKAKKDRPDDYPADLDEKQRNSIEKTYARQLSDNYLQMISFVSSVATFLATNADLIEKPKRSYQVM